MRRLRNAARVVAPVLAAFAAIAVAIELTVSHGSADLLWLTVAVALLIASYRLQRWARATTVYRRPE